MHIFYLSFNFIPGRGTHTINIMNTCHAFANQPETKVTLLINHNSKIHQQFGMDVWKFYGIEKNFEISYFPAPSSFIGKWDVIRKLMGLFLVFNYIFKVFKNSQRKFIIYSRHVKIIFLIKVISKLCKNKYFQGFFCELHSLASSKRALNYCRGIIAISQTLKSDILEKRILKNPEKILIAHDGVNLNRFQGFVNKNSLRNELNITKNKKAIVYTGRIIFGKGVDVLIKAFSQLTDQEDLLLILIGKTYSQEFGKLIEDLKLDNVLFIDFIPPMQIYKYQLCADILVIPTTRELSYARYTSPIKLFEYMAAKVPIVASALESIKEIIKHKENGLLFEPANVESLFENLQFALVHNDEMNRMVKQAAIDVHKYTWDSRTKNILKFIKANNY